MVELLTLTLFLLVAAGIAWAGLRAGTQRARGVHLLAPSPVQAAGLPPPTLLWRELVSRLGAVVPASEADRSRLKRLLSRAGFRHQKSATYFQGGRLLATLLFAAVGFAGGWQRQATPNKLLMATGGGAVLGYLAPMQYVMRRIRRRQNAIAHGLPNALDLMVVCVESGLGIDQTMLQVAKELQFAHPEICSEFTVMNLELRAGIRREDALHNLADRTGVEDVKKLVAVLVQTNRFGTSIAQCLRGHADYLRTMARQKAEERASKLAVKLVFPIFFCVLPTLFVVTIGPVMVRLVRDLVPMIENM
jgi:tight adherence protein C